MNNFIKNNLIRLEVFLLLILLILDISYLYYIISGVNITNTTLGSIWIFAMIGTLPFFYGIYIGVIINTLIFIFFLGLPIFNYAIYKNKKYIWIHILSFMASILYALIYLEIITSNIWTI